MAKDKTTTLGPSATYRNLDGSAPVVTVADVEFHDGVAVDVVEELGEGRAAKLLAKLEGNHFFEVEGSEKDHSDAADDVMRAANIARGKPAARAPAVKKNVAKKIAQEDAEHEDEAVQRAAEQLDKPQEPELPDDVSTPDKPVLEGQNDSRPRLPRSRN